ncbi:MAG: protein kinase domain-containing protein [Planctomycetia bacterium]
MSSSSDDFLFAQQAQALGYASEAQVEEAFRLQALLAREHGLQERVEGILRKRGWISEEQAARVRARIDPTGASAGIEGYRLLEKVGRGAMGTVYKALHLGLQRVVAIKVLHQDLATDSTQVARLKAEARLLASLDHPHIVRALDAGESHGFPYIVTEYVEGESLRDRLARSGPLPELEALRITRALADALEKARRMGVVHRDVKPGNVLLTRQGEPKLMDLGLAKGPVDTGITQQGATVGTPQYISPEQAQDPRKADTRSDIYSLGATLYALVTGKPPFEGTTLAEVIAKVLYETPTPPRVLNPAVSAETAYLIERMMLKDPSLRYQVPAQAVAAIDAILAGRSIVPEGFRGNWEAYLVRQRVRRWAVRGAVGLAASVALVLGGLAWQEQHAAGERRLRAEASAEALLPALAWGREDTRASVEARLARARALLAEVGDVASAPVARLREAERELAVLAACQDRWYALLGGPGEAPPADGGPVVAALVGAGNWRAAYARVEGFAREVVPAGQANPVAAELDDQRMALRLASSEAWQALERAAREVRPATLGAWVQHWAGFEQAAQRGFIEERDVREGIARAVRLHAQARAVEAAVLAHEAAFEAGSLEVRVRGEGAGRLLAEDLPAAQRELEARVAQAWSGELLEWTGGALLLGERGLVRLRMDMLAARVQAQVQAWAEQALAEAAALAREGQLAAAEQALAALESRLARLGAPALQARAALAREQVRAELLSAGALQQAALDAVLDSVLAALARLDGSTLAALAAAVRPDEATARALGPRLGEVQVLEALLGPAERLQQRAMEALAALQGARKRLVPRLRAGGSVERGWALLAVDVPGLAFEVLQGGGTPREARRVALHELEPAQVVDLARQGPSAPGDRLALALGAVALLGPGGEPLAGDLLAALEASDAALAALQEAAAPPRLVARVRARRDAPDRALPPSVAARPALPAAAAPPLVVARVRALRAPHDRALPSPEATAAGYHENARVYASQRKLSSAWYYVSQLLEDAQLRATRYVRENAAAIRELRKAIDGQIEAGSVERVLPGVRARSLGADRWEVAYDFDSDLQLGPQHWAAGQAVLEPVVGPALTPDPTRPQQRLHLLRGFDAPARDLPLVWPSIFDPAEPITVEFEAFAAPEPAFLAVDIDGAKVAVLSLDPRWMPAARVAPGAPLLAGEKRLPAVDPFGRGRGVAFHDGLDFGDPPAWRRPDGSSAWPEGGRGPSLPSEPPVRVLSGDLFAFAPPGPLGAASLRVKVVREWRRMSLFVDDRLVASEERSEWERRGTQSERQPAMRQGSGAIRLLTYTPLAIDNLVLTGTVRRAWLEAQRDKARAEAAPAGPGAPAAPVPPDAVPGR